jgi:hypothetical protein
MVKRDPPLWQTEICCCRDFGLKPGESQVTVNVHHRRYWNPSFIQQDLDHTTFAGIFPEDYILSQITGTREKLREKR